MATPSTATGTDYWVATYNGDSNNNAVTAGTASEPVIVSAASPAISTTQQPASAIVGASIADKATVSGGYNPTGTVTFKLYANSTASGTPLFSDTETLSGGTATSNSYTTTATGTDYWVATYNGDSNNNAVTAGAASEPVIVSAPNLTISTTPGGTATLGNIIIRGTKYLDLTGNGFSADDTPLAGVPINLYNSTANLGTSSYVAETTTAADGTYSFANLNPGTYYVQEVVPSGYIQTGGGPNGSAGAAYYTITTTAGHVYSGYNFDDYLKPTCEPTNVSYQVTHNGSTTTVSSLGGNTHAGDTVAVSFTVPAGMNDQLTLVSYSIPTSNAPYYAQVIYQQETETFARRLFTCAGDPGPQQLLPDRLCLWTGDRPVAADPKQQCLWSRQRKHLLPYRESLYLLGLRRGFGAQSGAESGRPINSRSDNNRPVDRFGDVVGRQQPDWHDHVLLVRAGSDAKRH